MAKREGEYEAAQRSTLAEVPGLRVRRLQLSAGQSVPWHYHNHITDTFICLRGPVFVRTREPEVASEVERELQAGDIFAVSPRTHHLVTGAGSEPCEFIIIQGVGEYDYVGLED